MKLHSRALFDLDEDRVYPVDSAVLLQSKLGVTAIKSLVPPCRGIWASDIPIVQKIDEDEMWSYITLKDLGGWKSERTVVSVYLRPDEQAQRTALARLAANGQ
jgi:hypothetical protein